MVTIFAPQLFVQMPKRTINQILQLKTAHVSCINQVATETEKEKSSHPLLEMLHTCV